MTISIRPSAKFSLAGAFGRSKPTAKKSVNDLKRAPLERHELAKLFAPEMDVTIDSHKARKLNKGERQDRDTLSNLRGALYSRD